jgi:DNA-binding MarR family transcriptional regulator
MAEQDPERQLEFVIDEIARMSARIFNNRYRDTGMNGTQVAALIWLSHAPEGMSQSELAARVGLSKVAAGTLVDVLESGRFVRRARSPTDRRVQIVAITRDGLKIVRESNLETEDLRRAIRRGTTETERRQAFAVLDRMRANLREIKK